MVSQRRRIHGFQGTDQEYISYLESLILVTANRPPPPPCSPASPIPSLFPPLPEARDEVNDASDSEETPTDSLVFIRYSPNFIPPVNRKGDGRRWEREMDKMVTGMTTKGLSSRRAEIGLTSEADIVKALDIMIYGKPQTDPIAGDADLSIALDRPSNAVLQILDDFDTTTAALEVDKNFTAQMCHFRRFLSVSICCVALHNGTNPKIVNEVMRKRVSDSSEKNLARLRNGALWVNGMMVELAGGDKGNEGDEGKFGHLAYELFVLWGRSLAQYGEFSDAGENGIAYFKKRIPRLKPGPETQSSLPFWVPFIIKMIVGDLYSLQSICDALKYGTDSRIHEYPRYFENYRTRRVPLSRPLRPAKRTRRQDPTSKPRLKRPRYSTAPEDEFQGNGFSRRSSFEAGASPQSGCHDSMRCLLDAAEHVEGRDQPLPFIGNLPTVEETYPTSMEAVTYPFTSESETNVMAWEPILPRLSEINCTWEPIIQSPPGLGRTMWEPIFGAIEIDSAVWEPIFGESGVVT